MNIQENYHLINDNTFKISVYADYFVRAFSAQHLIEALTFAKQKNIPYLVIGGGSNLLFTRNFPGIVILIAIPGIALLQDTAHQVTISLGAGEVWEDIVQYCLAHEYFGIENLTKIPGTVGAAPVQNIGAYGVEIKDVFVELDAICASSLRTEKFSLSDCQFSYRQSIFKAALKDKFIITRVTLALHKSPTVVVTDKTLNHELSTHNIHSPSPMDVHDTVSAIRARRLPDWHLIGNAGSFYMNPHITMAQYQNLKLLYPEMVAFVVGEDRVKVAAGWLVDQCGWRGYRENDYGVFQNNPLVLVNYGKALGEEILQLSARIKKSVLEKFNIALEMEPRVY